MTLSSLDYNARPTSLEEQYLYDHFQEWVRKESPEELLERFRCLFVRGKEYQDPTVRLALVKILNSKQAEQEFKLILNRCFYILISNWQKQPQQQAIPQLVKLCEEVLPPRGEYYRTANRLRKLMSDFTKSDQYLKLRRLGRIISNNQDRNGSIGHLIYRYPYLYENCLLSEDNDYEHLKVIWQIQNRVQHQFELDLSQYVTYKVRLEQVQRTQTSKGQTIRPLKNPTLLQESDFDKALRQFVGPIEGGDTHRDLSRRFLTHSLQSSSYKAFKDDLYDYLIAAVDSQYGKHQFNEKLYSTIQSILPDANSQKLNEFLLLRTASRILNFLIVDSHQRPNHHIFVDLVTNLGATNTVSLLLKVVLLSSKVKPHLEKRFAILFDRYESYSLQEVPWLVKALENLLIALSVHFGKADLSCIKQII